MAQHGRWLPSQCIVCRIKRPNEDSPHCRRSARPSNSSPPSTIAYCCVVMVIAYAARGASGFGAAAAMPLLGLVIPLKVLVPAWTLIGIAAGIALIGSDRKKVAWPSC